MEYMYKAQPGPPGKIVVEVFGLPYVLDKDDPRIVEYVLDNEWIITRESLKEEP